MSLVLKLLMAGLLVGCALWLGHTFAPSLLTLDGLRQHLTMLEQFRDERPVTTAAMYLGIYILASVFALPSAQVLTLASGALFGFWQGVLLTSFASSIGATLSMIISRLLLRQLIATRFATALAQVNRGLAGSGWIYLASLRLTPVFPFVLINLLFGLTAFPVWLFYVISQVFMFPATLVYVNAGTQLGSLTSLSGILSPRMLGALMLLALLGPLSRLTIRRLERSA
ncbi:MAG: VTT domain-containing protein [Acidobacteriaceae bacterium]|jgi:uncharacterized membrane protein YdjX (TVP38/TMEM64 family)|nr:VTT domain-containing protein [Acidobacteriaceae bacterium]